MNANTRCILSGTDPIDKVVLPVCSALSCVFKTLQTKKNIAVFTAVPQLLAEHLNFPEFFPMVMSFSSGHHKNIL